MIPIAKPFIEKEEINNVIEVLKSGFLARGKWVEDFEKLFADYIGVPYSIATVNGTAALDLALKAIGIKMGDEVIVPDFSFIATSNSVLFQNAKPVFVDVEEQSFNINIKDLSDKITSKTKAIICVHLFGNPCNLGALEEISRDNNLFLIEDCAQAHGAKYKNRKVGSFGVGCFSFYPTKNMTTGEGGMITSTESSLSKKIKLLINHGQTNKYTHEILGYNLRMNNIQAAIGLAQLKKLDNFNKKRIENANYYNHNITNEQVTLPLKQKDSINVYHQYVLRIKNNRSDFIKFLEKNGIQTAIHYPLPLHLQPLYRNLKYPKDLCPISTQLSKEVVSIPVYPQLKKEELNFIVDIINSW